ncbi:MAG: extracellular matrix regulator RemB [Bacteroidota bacterium]
MFLHIGAQVSISLEDLVAIMDMDTLRKSALAPEFVSRVKASRTVVSVDGQEPRSAVITSSGVYLSSISLPTLKRRLASVYADVPDRPRRDGR